MPHHRLDHLAVVVPDLARARENYRRLGFRLTPQSSHKGRLTPDGPVELWGAGNHCTMFQEGYFEIYGITDRARHHQHVNDYLAKYQGLHLIAMGCDNADATRQDLATRLDQTKDVIEVQRDVPYGEGTRLGRFRILHLPDGAFPEADLFFIEHPTRDVLWQPELLDQPNGVTGLAGVTVCSEDPAGTLDRLATILGLQPTADRFALETGFIEILSAPSFTEKFNGAAVPQTPFVGAAWFNVADLDATASHVASQDIQLHKRNDTTFWVAPDEAEGAVIVFAAGGQT